MPKLHQKFLFSFPMKETPSLLLTIRADRITNVIRPSAFIPGHWVIDRIDNELNVSYEIVGAVFEGQDYLSHLTPGLLAEIRIAAAEAFIRNRFNKKPR